MIQEKKRPTREDILMDFAVSEEGTPAERLEIYAGLYPEYEHELNELTQELTASTWDSEPDCSTVNAAAGMAALEDFARLEASLRTPKPENLAIDPFAAHDARGLRSIAKAFGCNVLFMGRVKDRMIRIEDLTRGFIGKLAGLLGTTSDALADFLAGPSRVPASARFKSDTKPAAVDKQSLAEALDTSGLTPEQKQHLSSL